MPVPDLTPAIDWAVAKLTSYGRDTLLALVAGVSLHEFAASPIPGTVDPAWKPQPESFFLLGCLGVLCVCASIASSDCTLRRKLRQIARLKQDGLVSAAEYKRLKEITLAWFATRRFGGAAVAAAKTPPLPGDGSPA